MKGIEIQIIVHTEQSASLSNLEIESNLADLDTKLAIFYEISAISNIQENGVEYGVIYANGTEFFTRMSYEDLKGLIKYHGK